LPVVGGTAVAVEAGAEVAEGKAEAEGEIEIEAIGEAEEEDAEEAEGEAVSEASTLLEKRVVTLAGAPAVMIPSDPPVGRRTPPRVAVALTGQSGRSETSWKSSSPHPPPQVSVLSPGQGTSQLLGLYWYALAGLAPQKHSVPPCTPP
jgi:hypothetical protein